jgi:hypothetical protein
MQPPLRLAAVAAVLTCLTTGAALAESAKTGGVRIHGPVTIQTNIGRSLNAAIGTETKAVTAAGAITNGVEIKGPLELRVHADEVTTVADGHKQLAITSVGSVHEGADISGPRDVTVSTGRVLNVPGRNVQGPSCVIIGSLGTIPACE